MQCGRVDRALILGKKRDLVYPREPFEGASDLSTRIDAQGPRPHTIGDDRDRRRAH